MSGISALIRALNYVEKSTQTEDFTISRIDSEVQAAVDGIMDLHKPRVPKQEPEVIIVSDSDEDEPQNLIRLPRRPSKFIKIQSRRNLVYKKPDKEFKMFTRFPIEFMQLVTSIPVSNLNYYFFKLPASRLGG